MSSMLINKIKANKDEYSYDQINCFEKPVGIILNNFCQTSGNLFYMYVSLLKGYKINKPRHQGLRSSGEMTAIIHILKDIFNIDLNQASLTEELHNPLMSRLSSQNPVLVPGNLKELYYSNFYKTENWPHLFLLKGFDFEKSIYYILDSVQLRTDTGTYKDFVIEYSKLERVFKSYVETYDVNDFYYFRDNFIKEIYPLRTILLNCLDVYLDEMQAQPFREVDILNMIADKTYDIYDLSALLMKTIKYKNVFFQELIGNVKSIGREGCFCDEFSTITRDIINEWNTFSNLYIADTYRNKPIDINKVNNKIRQITALEKNAKDMVYQIYKALMKEQMENKEKNHKEVEFIFENNDNNIISQSAPDEFIFSLCDGKIYNSWTDDNAPKVLLCNMNLDHCLFNIKIKKIEMDINSQFLAGIVLRTKSNDLYFWGILSGKSLRFEHSGVTEKIFDIPKLRTNEEIMFQVRVNGTRCEFHYSYEEGLYEYAGEYDLKEELMEIGIGCKTWDCTEKIKIIFTHPEFHSMIQDR